MLLIITGPTACGKTAAAEQISRKVHGEIVSADSGTRYRKMRIGTGRYTISDDVPYHIIDDLDVGDISSSYDWTIKAGKAVEDITSRDKVPIICGGSMHFIELFLSGIISAPPPDNDLRDHLIRMEMGSGPYALYHFLECLSPEDAGRVHPHDRGRIMRYIEKAIGQDLIEEVPGYQGEYRLFFIAPKRDVLNDSIRERTKRMMDMGWFEEVRGLLYEGYGPDAPGFRSTGYRHVISMVNGDLTYEEGERRINSDTVGLSRKQMKWKSRFLSELVEEGSPCGSMVSGRILEMLHEE
ncbi:MAG: hypothetical protein JXA22_04750 [Candidatus Thermoplasmatota archaeon]|nr:hypothetical protein [Candidatus Thermoplasmatota archaeon]